MSDEQDPSASPRLPDLLDALNRAAVSTSRRVLVLALLTLGVLAFVTGVLTTWYHRQLEARATQQFGLAEQQARTDPPRALIHYRTALALERDSLPYRRALGLALLANGKDVEAERQLSDVLQRDPVDGPSNLLLARLAVRRGQRHDAEALYQRAIYGRWPDDSAGRLAARFELVDWLEQLGNAVAARGELITLQAELPDAAFLQQQLADRFMRAAAPAAAAAIYRREANRFPTSLRLATAWAEAELAAGRVPEARRAATRGLAHHDGDPRLRIVLDASNAAIALDPTPRGLSASQRDARARQLVARAMQDFERCTATSGSASPDLAILREPVAALLAQAPPRAPSPDQIASALTLAEHVWTARVGACGSDGGPLAWLFARVADRDE